MGSNQQYSLTWGEFGTSLVSAVQLLRGHGDLVDVTLAAGGRSFPAHKIVLCAASPFLLNLLKSTPCQHPVVLLAGVTADDLEALLEFMYRGEVSVDPTQLPSLLQAAHYLSIQGLAPGTVPAEKPEEMVPSRVAPESVNTDATNSFLPVRKRRLTKHRSSPDSGSGGKWPRQDGSLSSDGEGRLSDPQTSGQSASAGGHDMLNIPEVGRRTWGCENSCQTPEDQLCSPPATGVGKGRAASDQPGACPLCGATLRQARNLRRHLLTSCKYRGAGLPPELPTSGPFKLVQLQLLPPYSTIPQPESSSYDPGSQPCEELVCKVSPVSSPISASEHFGSSSIESSPLPGHH